jgi:murein DD-endopeptidase MepM/ murein hydrolase activator NlpD
MKRRDFLAGLFFVPTLAHASGLRLSVPASAGQGTLVVGSVEKGAELTLDGAPLRPAADGRFAFGITWDRTTSAHLDAVFADGSRAARDVVPVPRDYEVQRIDGLPEETVSPPPEILERIKAESAKVRKVREIDGDGAGFVQTFEWPIPGIVTGVFGSQRILNGKPMAPHFGIDIAAPAGTPIHAPAAGVVTLAEPDLYLSGGTTVIDHGHGVSTVYLHQEKLLATVGDRVEPRMEIGLVGASGRATGPHLHWGMNWFQMRLDPSCATAQGIPQRHEKR